MALSTAETGIVLAVLGVTVIAFSTKTLENDTSVEVSAALQLQRYCNAASEYIQENSLGGQNYLVSANGSPTDVSPAALAGRLPVGFTNSSATRQQFMATVVSDGSKLDWICFLYGGVGVDDSGLAAMASSVSFGGAAVRAGSTSIRELGGFTDTAVTTFSTGAADPAPGSFVIKREFSATQVRPDFIHTDAIPGDPGANTMRTDLNLGGNRASNASSFDPAGTANGAGLTAARMATLNRLNNDHASGRASVGATANALAVRDNGGRLKATDPTALNDVATRNYVDNALSALGAGTLQCTYVSGPFQTRTSNAVCPANHFIMTGGCRIQGQLGQTWYNTPTSIDTWSCVTTFLSDQTQAHAICCSVQ